MSATELRALLAALGWTQGQLADWAGVTPRTARRWAAGDPDIPDDVLARLRALAAGDVTDSWIFGDGDATGHEYVVHLARPRFVARLVDEDDPDEAATADTLGGITLALGDGLLLCELRWIDPPPPDLLPLIQQARAALSRVAARDRTQGLAPD